MGSMISEQLRGGLGWVKNSGESTLARNATAAQVITKWKRSDLDDDPWGAGDSDDGRPPDV